MAVQVVSAAGIGDLLLWKMVEQSTGRNIDTIKVRRDIIKTYRLNPESYESFLAEFLSRLFPQSVRSIIDDRLPTEHAPYHSITTTSLYDTYFPATPVISKRVPFQYYAVIQTKGRFIDTSDVLNLRESIIPKLCNTLEQVGRPIVLMGEKDDVEQNLEVRLNPIQSMYAYLKTIQVPIVDLTRPSLYSETTIDELDSDLQIIHAASCSIVFGYGGPLQLSAAFARTTISYIGGIEHPVIEAYQKVPTIHLHRDVSDFVSCVKRQIES